MSRSVFIADLHLSPARPQEGEAFVRFLAEQRDRTSAIFLMGDLFDFWIGPQHLRLPDYRRELAAIRSTVRNGVRVVMFKGNRDFYFGDAVAAGLGVEVVSDWSVETFGPHRTYLCHGDLLCAGDHRYQAMRRVLRSHLVTAAATALPAWVGLRLAAGARSVSKAEVARKSMTSMDLCPATLERVFRGRGDLARPGRGRDTGPVDTLICGHIHRPAERRYNFGGRDCRVFVLGPWDRGPCWLEFADGAFTFHGAG
jgi:UDP-2,3-diacylglucosamine hydrolase